jgi:hypothetical protein
MKYTESDFKTILTLPFRSKQSNCITKNNSKLKDLPQQRIKLPLKVY